MEDEDFQHLKQKILKLTKIDLDSYKSQQMRRRLDMFVGHSGCVSVTDYCLKLERDRDALTRLTNFLTINVSEFFRDSALFDTLRKQVLPGLLRESPKLNVWSAGCSHGAEPYSVAMILDSISSFSRHRILGTDIDEDSLARARSGGPYPPAEVRGVPQVFLRKYFATSDDGYTVNDPMKQRVQFQQQNLLRDRFERGFDLIICRNVTIYFTEVTKTELNRKFLDSLKPGGVLFIGGTEVMLDVIDLGFEVIRTSFYRKPATTAARVATRV